MDIRDIIKRKLELNERADYIFVKIFENIYKVHKSRNPELPKGKFLSTEQVIAYLNNREKVIVLDQSGSSVANFSL
ncbi:hypothetical protein ABEV41_01020 [Geobacillus thermodenitrificans]|uniref:hypothetical protein n=1 Tax=Geobacillus thermodenitrificans TaxID=33940 RepID=UPI003D1F5AA5